MKPLLGTLAVDSSFIIAIMLDEEGLGKARSDLFDRHYALIGVPSVLEIIMVMKGRYPNRDVFTVLDDVLSSPNLSLIEFNEEHLAASLKAFSRFGKGTGHKAGLNYGDCMAYAVAKVADVPLLFVGNDFTHTDLAVLPA